MDISYVYNAIHLEELLLTFNPNLNLERKTIWSALCSSLQAQKHNSTTVIPTSSTEKDLNVFLHCLNNISSASLSLYLRCPLFSALLTPVIRWQTAVVFTMTFRERVKNAVSSDCSVHYCSDKEVKT